MRSLIAPAIIISIFISLAASANENRSTVVEIGRHRDATSIECLFLIETPITYNEKTIVFQKNERIELSFNTFEAFDLSDCNQIINNSQAFSDHYTY